MTFLYAPIFEHDQLNAATHDNLHELFGVASISNFEHLGKMTRAGKIVNAKGEDVYLPHVERMAIPIAFIHGAENELWLPDSTRHTYEWLCEANGKELYSRYLIPRYGHIDCIFGKNASHDVYPVILKHLEAHLDDDADTMLARSRDMTPVAGTVDVAVPVDVLWECFTHADQWPRWNPCMFWVQNRDLVLGDELIWVFEPIHWWYIYKLPARAKIVELEFQRKVTWEVTFIPSFYARHTYSLEDLGDGRTRFGSWEQAEGASFRLLQAFWLAHFSFVKDASLAGRKRWKRSISGRAPQCSGSAAQGLRTVTAAAGIGCRRVDGDETE